MRFEVTNRSNSEKIYNVVGTNTGGTADELVLNGMVGEIGDRIEDNVYQLKPLTATAKKVFFVAEPEVDADESSVEKNALYTYANKLGAVVDAVEIPADRKFAIAENGIVGTIVGKKGYVYAKVGERKLQYKVTKPEASDNAVLVAIIEEVVPATQGAFVGVGSANLALSYNMVRCRVL